jgi:hypothetical protein
MLAMSPTAGPDALDITGMLPSAECVKFQFINNDYTMHRITKRVD